MHTVKQVKRNEKLFVFASFFFCSAMETKQKRGHSRKRLFNLKKHRKAYDIVGVLIQDERTEKGVMRSRFWELAVRGQTQWMNIGDCSNSAHSQQFHIQCEFVSFLTHCTSL